MKALKKFSPEKKTVYAIFVAFALLSLIKIAVLPIEALRGLGDIQHFYNLAKIPGLPYLDYWVEFPPLSAYLFEFIILFSGESISIFSYYFIVMMTCVNLANIVLFNELLGLVGVNAVEERKKRLLIYATVLFFLPYTWWYFDSLTVFFLLLGWYFYLKNKHISTVIVIAIGFLTKYFPILFFVVYFVKQPKLGDVFKYLIVFFVIVLLPYSLLYALSPDFTLASLVSQSAKGSWETVWALIDGNLQTGNFGPLWERWDPGAAYRQIGNLAAISSRLTLIVFAGLGLLGILKIGKQNENQSVSLLLFTMSVFFLWSPGWSPQWVLYLIPIILLLKGMFRFQLLLVLLLVLINLAEWPLIIGMQLTSFLPVTIISRTVILIGLAVYAQYLLRGKETHLV